MATHQPGVRAPAVPDELLERADHLAALDEAFESASAEPGGRLVLVGGEAGVGKSALLRRWCEDRGEGTEVFWGACDALLTPGPLGPLFDVAEAVGGELETLVGNGAPPHEIAGALMRALDRRRPPVLVVEDLHWADEATLDVLRIVGRRLRTLSALVLISYRDDELDATHPLRMLLGELAREPAVVRLDVEPLTEGAVAELAEPYAIDGEELFRQTNGNSFFVTEVLAAGGDKIPATVRDAALARAARLEPPARRLLDAVAIAQPQAEVWLLEALAPEDVGSLEDCLASGMLRTVPGGVAFRHELGRLAVEGALAPNRRVELHRAALARLVDPPTGAPDLARLAHHAEGAADGEAVLHHAAAAAERAAALGAHREAAAQFARALRFASATSLETQAEFLERRAEECNLTDQSTEAIEAAERALEHRRKLGDPVREGRLLHQLSGYYWCPGRLDESSRALTDAIAILEQLPPGRELAEAYGDLAGQYADVEDREGALAWAEKAIAVGEKGGSASAVTRGHTVVGIVKMLVGDADGLADLERALALAEREELESRVAGAHINIAWTAMRTHSHATAERGIAAGIPYCQDRGLDLYRRYLQVYGAELDLERGRWTEAFEGADAVLREPSPSQLLKILPRAVMGLVRARRGDPEVWSLLDAALPLAVSNGQLQATGPVALARAEAAWLEGDLDAIAGATDAALADALRREATWMVGALGAWRRRAGLDDVDASAAAGPWAAQLAGDWRGAAQEWDALGCRYEASLARADGDDEGELRRALDDLRALGAAPAAAIVARRLRELGVRDVPRGPRRTTKSNAAGLTQREVEVLELVAQGLRNAEIAERLFLSEKTVGHHVSAILRKLDVGNRGEAVAAAIGQGLVGRAG